MPLWLRRPASKPLEGMTYSQGITGSYSDDGDVRNNNGTSSTMSEYTGSSDKRKDAAQPVEQVHMEEGKTHDEGIQNALAVCTLIEDQFLSARSGNSPRRQAQKSYRRRRRLLMLKKSGKLPQLGDEAVVDSNVPSSYGITAGDISPPSHQRKTRRLDSLLSSSPIEWKLDSMSGSTDSAEVKKLSELVPQLQALLAEHKTISAERKGLENRQKRILNDAQQINIEKRALELRLRNVRLKLDQKDDDLLELEFSINNIMYQDERRSGMEKRLREDIETLQGSIQERIEKEEQSIHDILNRIMD
ncbi:MAG: hypothetical protein Q9166_004292 [cf. Caloplaca sp. 2 TL-2023]